jgi:hypothetical protein
MERKQKNVLFVLCSLITWGDNSGLNYILLRFILPMAFLLLLHRRIVPFVTKMRLHWVMAQVLLSAASTACVLICLAVSPEMALAFFVALSIYWSHLSWTVGPRYLLVPLATAGCLLLMAANWRDYFESVMSFGGGGNNFPVIPAINILFYLFTVLYATPLAVGVAITAWRHPDSVLFAGWAALTVALIPGALGRCDFGHTFFYGLPALLLTWVVLRRQSRKLHLLFVFIVAASFLGFKISHFQYGALLPYKVSVFIDRVMTPGESAPPPEPTLSRDDRAGSNPLKQPFSELARYGKVYVPLGCNEDLFAYLVMNDYYGSDYFIGTTNLFTEQQLTRKLAELKRAKTIIVRKGLIDDIGSLRDWDSDHVFLSRLFLFPYCLNQKRDPLLPVREIAEHIRVNFVSTSEFRSYEVMIRKSGPE